MRNLTELSKIFILLLLCFVLPLVRSLDLENLFEYTAKKAEEKVDQYLTRCYGDYGCFSLGGKFVSLSRPVNLFPFPAEDIKTKLSLYTRRNPNTPEILIPNNVSDVNITPFNFSMPTKIIIHGFLEREIQPWINTMRDEFLIHEDVNVIAVNWYHGAQLPYTQAVANARLVGAIVARFLSLMQAFYDYPPSMVHIIGHSLGAHIAGYVGEKLITLGRISGLDPAGPYFENTDPVVRLDPSDATFVDVIHTDGASLLSRVVDQLAFGMQKPSGHVDFYPNGGVKQPGCEESMTGALEREDMNLYRGLNHWIACRHLRAYEYFSESINGEAKCSFIGYECNDYDDFNNGHCTHCGKNRISCAKMGFHADEYKKHKRAPGAKFFLKTNTDPPYCTNHHVVTIQTARRRKRFYDEPINGIILLEIDGDKRRRELKEFDEKERTFEHDQKYVTVMSSHVVGPLSRIQLQILETRGGLTNQLVRMFLGKPMLEIDYVDIEDLENGEMTEFCSGIYTVLKPGTKLTLFPRPKC